MRILPSRSIVRSFVRQTSFENDDFIQQNFARILSFAHHIEFGQHADRSFAHRIATASHDQGVGRDQIDVRRCHGENETILVADVFEDDIVDLLDDIRRLTLRRHFDHTGQIDQR